MITEKLLALEGYREGLDKSKRISREKQQLENELLIEYVIREKVRKQIFVTEDEIKEAINKSKVRFKFRYWVESNQDRAQQISSEMQEKGYSTVISRLLSQNEEIKIDPKLFESDYISWMELSPNIFDAIKDLPYGEVSDPVYIGGDYWIFQILDIRRNAVLESEYKTQSPRFEQILFYQKLTEDSIKYVSDLMTPLNVRTKGETLGALASAYWEWMNDENLSKTSFYACALDDPPQTPELKVLREKLGNTLMEYSDKRITLGDFLEEYPLGHIWLEYPSKRALLTELNNVLAIYIRNRVLRAEAEANKIDELPELQAEMQQWMNKWVYEAYRLKITDNLMLQDSLIYKYFLTNKQKYIINLKDTVQFEDVKNQVKRDALREFAKQELLAKSEALKERYTVEINQVVLDSIGVIESQKSRWFTVNAFKSGSNRLACPVVDAAWGF